MMQTRGVKAPPRRHACPDRARQREPLAAGIPSKDATCPEPIIHLNREKHNDIMTKLELKGKWNTVKGKLKSEYGQLTDDDLVFAEGEEEQLVGNLQQKLGKTKEEVREMLAGMTN